MNSGAAHFDQCGQFLHYPLHDTDEEISPGLAKRLVDYATKRANERGLFTMVKDWELEVYTTDGKDKPADRNYNVRWKNPQDTEIELCRIMTRDGWPFLDHGFTMQ